MKWVWQMASLSQFGTFLLVLPFEGINNGGVIATLVFGFIFMMLASYCEEKEEE